MSNFLGRFEVSLEPETNWSGSNDPIKTTLSITNVTTEIRIWFYLNWSSQVSKKYQKIYFHFDLFGRTQLTNEYTGKQKCLVNFGWYM